MITLCFERLTGTINCDNHQEILHVANSNVKMSNIVQRTACEINDIQEGQSDEDRQPFIEPNHRFNCTILKVSNASEKYRLIQMFYLKEDID